MSIWRKLMKLERRGGAVAETEVRPGEFEPASFFEAKQKIESLLNTGRPIDLNDLPPTAKEAARAIVDEAKAKIILVDGRYQLVSRTPNRLVEFLSLGATA